MMHDFLDDGHMYLEGLVIGITYVHVVSGMQPRMMGKEEVDRIFCPWGTPTLPRIRPPPVLHNYHTFHQFCQSRPGCPGSFTNPAVSLPVVPELNWPSSDMQWR